MNWNDCLANAFQNGLEEIQRGDGSLETANGNVCLPHGLGAQVVVDGLKEAAKNRSAPNLIRFGFYSLEDNRLRMRCYRSDGSCFRWQLNIDPATGRFYIPTNRLMDYHNDYHKHNINNNNNNHHHHHHTNDDAAAAAAMQQPDQQDRRQDAPLDMAGDNDDDHDDDQDAVIDDDSWHWLLDMGLG